MSTKKYPPSKKRGNQCQERIQGQRNKNQKRIPEKESVQDRQWRKYMRAC